MRTPPALMVPTGASINDSRSSKIPVPTCLGKLCQRERHVMQDGPQVPRTPITRFHGISTSLAPGCQILIPGGIRISSSPKGRRHCDEANTMHMLQEWTPLNVQTHVLHYCQLGVRPWPLAFDTGQGVRSSKTSGTVYITCGCTDWTFD